MFRYSLIVLFALSSFKISFSQTSTGATGNVISTAMSFLTISADSRAAGMADLGAATTPDATAMFWNPGKLVFNDNRVGFSASFTPWLRNLGINDMWIGYLSGYVKPKNNDLEAFGFHLNYFKLGEINFTADGGGGTPIDQGTGKPKEFSVGLTYSRKLSDNLGLGIGVKFIRSDLANGFTGNTGSELKPANTLAADLGIYNKREIYLGGRVFDMSLGASITNLGGKVTYSSNSNKAFIPANLKIGTFFQTEIDQYNKIGFGFDFNKLLVPTPDSSDTDRQDQSVLSGAFNSFGDAPDGFSEELKEISISIGAEYWYQDVFSVRAGYFHESKEKGNRKYISAGAGLRYQDFGLDVAYLIPTQQNNPLANTIRFTLSYLVQ